MGVDVRVVQWLRQNGQEAIHVRDEGLQRLANGDIFAKATAEGRVTLTFDLDFGEILALSKGRGSVIIFRLNNARASNVIARLSNVLRECSTAISEGAIITVEEHRH